MIPRGGSLVAGFWPAVCVIALLAVPVRAELVRGFVRDEQGNPVFNADFNVYDAASGEKLPPSDKTDGTGKYRLLVDPGRYDLLCRPVIGGGLAARILRDVPVTGTLDLDFTLPAGARVLGRVTDAANPDPNTNAVYPCDLDFDRSDDGSRQPSQGNVTSPFGTFVSYVEGGSYSVTATPAADTTLAPTRIYDWVVPTPDILQMPLVFATHLAGTIRDTNGAPVPGVVLKFDIPNGRRQPASKHLTDANGFYRLGIAPGIYRVTAEPPLDGPYAAVRIPNLDVTSSQLQNFTLPLGAVVTGLVSDTTGRPVANASWLVTLEGGAIAATPGNKSGYDGQYRMVLVPGLYKMRLTAPASSGLDSVVLRNVAITRDTTIDVDYAVHAGPVVVGTSPVIRFAPSRNPTHITATVSLVLNQPIASALLEIYDVTGRRTRVLYSGPLGVGTHNLPWDGRRVNGARAHTGVYLVRARLDGYEQVTRFVLLP